MLLVCLLTIVSPTCVPRAGLHYCNSRRKLILADLHSDVDSRTLTQYISSWSLEPQIDNDLIDRFNEIIRVETRAETKTK
jgi:hypothetical protein